MNTYAASIAPSQRKKDGRAAFPALISQYTSDDKNYNECDTYHDDNSNSSTTADDIISSDIGSITNDKYKNKTPLSGIIKNNFRYQDLLKNSDNSNRLCQHRSQQ